MVALRGHPRFALVSGEGHAKKSVVEDSEASTRVSQDINQRLYQGQRFGRQGQGEGLAGVWQTRSGRNADAT